MKYFLLTGFFCLSFANSFACLNEFHQRADGKQTGEAGSLPYFYRLFNIEFSQKFVDCYDLTQKDSIPYDELSDVSVHLAKLGRYEESLSLLIWLNERHPDQYQIIANLGTLYELNGNVDSAYYFIERSMKINPDSHHGSEWVHLLILKAKKEMSKDPNWIFNHQVLNLQLNKAFDLGSSEMAQVEDTIWAIGYQMVERVPFTPTPDPILANIFNELGDLLALHTSVTDAYAAYLIAQEYDDQNKFNIGPKLEKLNPMVDESEMGRPKLNTHFRDDFISYGDELPCDDDSVELTPDPIRKEPTVQAENQNSGVLLWSIIGLSVLAFSVYIILKLRR